MEASAATVLLLALCLSCLLLLLRGGRWGTKARLPPGPRPLPFIGNLLHLDAKNMLKSLMELSRQYGSLFTIHMGSRPVVVLCGYQTVKEALVDRGIAFSNGEKWKTLRRFAIQTLRDFGMGKRSIEERIQEEAQCLVKEFAERTAEPFDPTFLLGCSVSNVICSIVFGDRFDYEDQHFLTFIGLINDNFRLFSSPCAQMYNIFPHIMYYLPGPHNQIFANFEKLRALVKEMAKAHQASLDPSCPRDFIDCFLLKMQQEKEDPHSFFHTDTLIMTTHNLFFAGTETISTTLRYALLILMKFPEVAAKVQEEIAKVIGSERQPSIADRASMPYTDAVIHEVQRFADIIPMGIPHALTKDAHFRGFFFPEGTNVLPFFHSVHQDATQFKNPEMFDPGHFLDEEGAFRRSNAFMPFSTALLLPAQLPTRAARPLTHDERHRERAAPLLLPPAAPLMPPPPPPGVLGQPALPSGAEQEHLGGGGAAWLADSWRAASRFLSLSAGRLHRADVGHRQAKPGQVGEARSIF